MANSRAISTRVAITGESEYTAALKNINAELRSVQSSLRLVETSYAGNANSLAALTDKQKALQDVLNVQNQKLQTSNDGLNNAKTAAEGYRQQIEQTKAAIQQNNLALDAAKKQYGEGSKEVKDLEAKDRELNAELVKQEAYLRAAEKGVSDWETKVNNSQIAVNGTTAALEKNTKYLDEAQKSTDKCATSIDNFGKETRSAQDPLEELLSGLKGGDEIIAGLLGSIVALAGTQGIKMLANAIKECAEASIDFEAEMAHVRRTVGDISDGELEELGELFKQLSTELPVTTNELAAIATTAGQLGVSKEYIGEFTQIIAQLAVVTGQTADEVATNMARIRNVTNMGEADYDRLASTIAAMGDASATTAPRIEEFMERIGAVASVAGFTVPEITAIGTAFSSAGVEASRGGTAFANVVTDIQNAMSSGRDDIQKFADVAGMTAGEFAVAWKSEPILALQALVDGIKGSSDQVAALAAIGVTDSRQLQSWSAFVNSAYGLSDAVGDANRAWAENTALTEKAGIEANTMAADITKMKNAFTELRANLGDLFTPAVDKFVVGITRVVDGIADGVDAVHNFVDEHELLKKALETGFKGAALGGLGTMFNIPNLGAQVIGAEVGANLWGRLFGNSDEAADGIEEVSEALDDVDEAASTASEAVNEYADAVKAATGESVEITGAVQDVIYDLEDLASAYADAQDAAKKSIDSQVDLFDTFEYEVDDSTKTLSQWEKDIETQTKNLTTYGENLGKAIKYGVSEVVVSALADGDAESAYHIAQIIEHIESLDDAGDELSEAAQSWIDEFNGKFEENEDARGYVETFIAAAKTDLIDGIYEAQSELADMEWDTASIQALIEHAFSTEGLDYSVISATLGTEFGSTITDALGAAEVDSSGLDGVMEAAGEAAASSFATGASAIGETSDELKATVTETNEAVATAATEALGVTTDTMGSIVSTVASRLDELNRQTKSKMSAILLGLAPYKSEFASAGASMGNSLMNSMISAVNNKTSSLYYAVLSAVRTAAKAQYSASYYVNGSHASGLDYVPFDGYIAELHKGEMVLTEAQAAAMRSANLFDASVGRMSAVNSSAVQHNINASGTIRVEGVNNNGELVGVQDIIMDELVERMKQEARLR